MNKQFRDAIAAIESRGSGDYSALGPWTGGDRAYGRYQVMGKNVGPWTQQALGYAMSPEEFAANPQAQDAVFDHVFGGYVNKYGPEGAAQAWFGGPGSVGKGGRQDVLGTSVSGYGQKFMKNIGSPAQAGDPAPQQGFTPPGQTLPQEAAPFASAPEAVASAAGAPKAASMAGLLGGLGEIIAQAGQAPKMQVPALNAVADRVSAGTGINTQDPLGLETGNPAQSAAPSPVPGATMQNGAPDPGQISPTIANMLAGMEKLAPKPPAPAPVADSGPKWKVGASGDLEPMSGSLQSQAAPIGPQPHSDRFDKMMTAPVVPSPAKPTLYTDPTGGGYETNPNAQGPNTTTPAMNPGPIQPIPGQRTVPNGAIVPPNEGRFDKMNPFGPKATPQGVTTPHEGRFDKMTGDNGDGFLKLPDTAPTPTAKPVKKPFDTMGFLTALGGVMGALGGGSPDLDVPSLSGVSHKPEFSGLPVTKGLLGMLGLGQ